MHSAGCMHCMLHAHLERAGGGTGRRWERGGPRVLCALGDGERGGGAGGRWGETGGGVRGVGGWLARVASHRIEVGGPRHDDGAQRIRSEKFPRRDTGWLKCCAAQFLQHAGLCLTKRLRRRWLRRCILPTAAGPGHRRQTIRLLHPHLAPVRGRGASAVGRQRDPRQLVTSTMGRSSSAGRRDPHQRVADDLTQLHANVAQNKLEAQRVEPPQPLRNCEREGRRNVVSAPLQ